MEYNEILTSAGGNLITLVAVTVVYVVYKRCSTCHSHVDTGCIQCDTDKVIQRKRNKKKELICEAFDDHLRRSQTELGEV